MTSAPDSPRLSVVVPVWKPGLDPELLRRSLEKLHEHYGGSVELIGVINGSDASDWTGALPPGAAGRWACLSQNVGVSRAWNIGASLAAGEILLFLNQDADPAVEDIDLLIGELASEDVTLAGVRGSFWGSADEGGFRHLANYAGEEPGDVDLVSGFLFAIPRARWASLGGIDEALTPFSGEEIDLALRTRESGGRIRALGRCSTRHRFGISSSRERVVAALGRAEPVMARSRRNLEYLWSKFEGEGFAGPSIIAKSVANRLAAGWEPAEVGLEEGTRGRPRLRFTLTGAPRSAFRLRLLELAAEGIAARQFGRGLEVKARVTGSPAAAIPLGPVLRGLSLRGRRMLGAMRGQGPK